MPDPDPKRIEEVLRVVRPWAHDDEVARIVATPAHPTHEAVLRLLAWSAARVLLLELGSQVGVAAPSNRVPIPWIKTTDRLPEKPGKASYEYVECAIFYKGEFLIRPWNCEHLCWDDEAHDDFFCNPLDPTHWVELRAP